VPRSSSPPLDVVLWHARRGPSVPPPDGVKESGLCARGDAAYRSVGRHFPSEKGPYATTRAETVISPCVNGTRILTPWRQLNSDPFSLLIFG
jgi:hypothetical protein